MLRHKREINCTQKKIFLVKQICHKCEPQQRDCTISHSLAPLSEDKVQNMISVMPKKTCDLGVLLTKVLKRLLKPFLNTPLSYSIRHCKQVPFQVRAYGGMQLSDYS